MLPNQCRPTCFMFSSVGQQRQQVLNLLRRVRGCSESNSQTRHWIHPANDRSWKGACDWWSECLSSSDEVQNELEALFANPASALALYASLPPWGPNSPWNSKSCRSAQSPGTGRAKSLPRFWTHECFWASNLLTLAGTNSRKWGKQNASPAETTMPKSVCDQNNCPKGGNAATCTKEIWSSDLQHSTIPVNSGLRPGASSRERPSS